jgi:hypothetical protein
VALYKWQEGVGRTQNNFAAVKDAMKVLLQHVLDAASLYLLLIARWLHMDPLCLALASRSVALSTLVSRRVSTHHAGR